RIEPDQPAVHSNLAGALRAQGNLDEALRQYRKALEIDPDDAAAGQALHELGGAEAAPRDSAAD
ncbi:MAG: tetratricopeptide repeat protein, partial [Myxococcales bacterium]|nr:tetratricopeptide repeat protein [Myxococcales bacterium]